jgi:hypothetical protein
MKNWILALGALSVVSGCSPIVLEPLSGTQAAETPVVPGTPTVGGDGGNIVLAQRASDVNWQTGEGFWPSLPPWQPDSLVLFFSTDAQQCAQPLLGQRCLGSGQFWQEVIIVPPVLAHPGLIDLTDSRISEFSTATLPDGSATCGGGGYSGPGRSGTLELIGDGASTLSAKLTDVESIMSHSIVDGVDQGLISLDGVYTGQLCGALPSYPPTPALAIRGADAPAGSGTPTPAADSLLVALGTLPDTCADPWAADDCTLASRLTFTLPAALQKPGMIDLSDPAIAASVTRRASGGSSVCEPPSGPFTQGTIEILSSDAAGLTFKVYQAFTPPSDSAPVFFDGLYSATICP